MLKELKDDISLCVDHDLVYTNRKIHLYQKEGVYLIQSYFEYGYSILHKHSASCFSQSALSKVRDNLKIKTKGIVVKIPVVDIYEDINPGNVGEIYFGVHHGMINTGSCQYSLQSFQYLLEEHRAWPSGFLNLCTDILCLEAKKRLQFLC
jgi:hypothetical protein